MGRIHGDGSVDQAGIKPVELKDDGSVVITISVSGFSRYGLRRR